MLNTSILFFILLSIILLFIFILFFIKNLYKLNAKQQQKINDFFKKLEYTFQKKLKIQGESFFIKLNNSKHLFTKEEIEALHYVRKLRNSIMHYENKNAKYSYKSFEQKSKIIKKAFKRMKIRI